MSNLTSYLWAQAQQRPVSTARFVAAELWRRGRLRWVNSFDRGLPSISAPSIAERLRPFLPAGCGEPARSDSIFPGCLPALRAHADDICRHEFRIFGRNASLGKELDWHCDWQTGHRWPLDPVGYIRMLDAPPGADVKRPWELARFHHSLALGRAYASTADPRYAHEFAAQVRSWIRANPYPRGIHWAMPMEIALRAINWLTAAAFFAQVPDLDAAFWREFEASLFLQGRFINAHREENPVARGNHHLSCVAGLLHLGVAFRDLPEGRAWLESARAALAAERDAQAGPDGVAHEGSSGYHCFVTELFLTCALLVARAESTDSDEDASRALLEKSWGAAFVAKLERMFDFSAALLAGRDAAPIWGDADDGRVLPLCSAESAAAAHLVTVGRTLFHRADWPAPHACEEVWWRLGRAPAAHADARESQPQHIFPAAGFYCFASRRLRGSIRCGPLGLNGWANHAHNDQLSFELACDGRAVIVDPGSYCYSGDAEARDRFRSSRAHNSPVVNGAEQNRFWPGLPFRIVDDARSRPLRWSGSARSVQFEGEHSGYMRLSQRVTVRRFLHLDRETNTLLVADTLTGQGSIRVEWFFQLAPGIVVQPLATPDEAPALLPAALRSRVFEKMKVRSAWRIGPLVLRLLSPEEMAGSEPGLTEGEIAPSYGTKTAAPRLRVACTAALPARIIFAVDVGQTSKSVL